MNPAASTSRKFIRLTGKHGNNPIWVRKTAVVSIEDKKEKEGYTELRLRKPKMVIGVLESGESIARMLEEQSQTAVESV